MQSPRLSADVESVVIDSDSANRVFSLFGQNELVEIIESVGIRTVIHEPGEFSAQLAVHFGLVESGKSAHLIAILPDVDVVLRGDYDVSAAHAHELGLDVDVLDIERTSETVHQLNLVDFTGRLLFGDHAAVLLHRLDAHQILHLLYHLPVLLDLPENQVVIHSVLLLVAEHQRAVREVAPLVVLLDIGEKQSIADRHDQPQAGALEAHLLDHLSQLGNAGGPEMNALVGVELHDSPDLARLLLHHVPPHREDVARGVPDQRLDVERRVDQNGIVVSFAGHQLQTSTLVSDDQSGHSVLGVLFAELEPLDGLELEFLFGLHVLQTEHLDFVEQDAALIVEQQVSLLGAENEHLAIGTPLDQLDGVLVVLAPESGTLDTADDHRAVFVADADLESVLAPLHVRHSRLAPVVYHLLRPLPALPAHLLSTPHHDLPLAVRRCQLVVLLVPTHDVHTPTMSAQRYVLDQSLRPLPELYHLHQTFLTPSHSNVVLLLLPTYSFQS